MNYNNQLCSASSQRTSTSCFRAHCTPSHNLPLGASDAQFPRGPEHISLRTEHIDECVRENEIREEMKNLRKCWDISDEKQQQERNQWEWQCGKVKESAINTPLYEAAGSNLYPTCAS